ncbi:zf-HC2 domain-containing protein [Ktedonobacteria bacterium brp13]|nr:zf-HC2 domain-containing protein [Ktedonobacteria bacterium brp13]
MTLHHEHHFFRSHCPMDQLKWFVNQTLSAEERVTVEAHLTECAACRAEVAVWTELRQVMRGVSVRTPEPRADLFMQIEQQLDVLPSPAPLAWLGSLLQACWFALTVCGEHFRAQARLIRRDLFWMPLFIVPLAGSLVYLPRPWQDTPGPAALLAALLTALGMAFLYGQRVDPAREIALVTRTSPRLVLGVRCCLVFGYDLLLNCGLVLPFLALHGVVTPAWFLVNWLAPLCCLSAIALLLSILVNSGTAVLVCALLWALRLLNSVQTILFGGSRPLPEAPWQQQYESFWHQGPLLFVVAILAVLLTFIVLERKERFVR